MRSSRHLPSGSKDRRSFKMVFDGILERFTESVNFFFIGYFFFKILLIDISNRFREAHEASVGSKYAARRTLSSRLHFRPIRTAVQKLFQKYTHVYSIFAPPHIQQIYFPFFNRNELGVRANSFIFLFLFKFLTWRFNRVFYFHLHFYYSFDKLP